MVGIFSLLCCLVAFTFPGLGFPAGHTVHQGMECLPEPPDFYLHALAQVLSASSMPFLHPPPHLSLQA